MGRLIGGLGTAAIVLGLVLAGIWALIDSFVVESTTAYLLPSLAGFAIVFLFVLALFALGAESDAWLETPYW